MVSHYLLKLTCDPVSVTIPNDSAHTVTCTNLWRICHFIILWLLNQVSNHEGQMRVGGKPADWAELGQSHESDTLKKEKRKKYKKEGGTQAPTDSWFWHLCPSRLAAHNRLSHPSPPSYFHHLPIGQLCKRERLRGRGHGRKQTPFLWMLCQACRDTFKDEGEVNVVGKMREPLKDSTNVS